VTGVRWRAGLNQRRSSRANHARAIRQSRITVCGDTFRTFGVSPDGQRFLLRMTADRPSTASIVVVTNWPALLAR
jgi:hypothetical protein